MVVVVLWDISHANALPVSCEDTFDCFGGGAADSYSIEPQRSWALKRCVFETKVGSLIRRFLPSY